MLLRRDHLEILEWTGALRKLAQEAYRVTRSDAVSTADVEDLRAQIEGLRHEVSDRPHTPVVRWLDNLQAEVDGIAPASSGALLSV